MNSPSTFRSFLHWKDSKKISFVGHPVRNALPFDITLPVIDILLVNKRVMLHHFIEIFRDITSI